MTIKKNIVSSWNSWTCLLWNTISNTFETTYSSDTVLLCQNLLWAYLRMHSMILPHNVSQFISTYCFAPADLRIFSLSSCSVEFRLHLQQTNWIYWKHFNTNNFEIKSLFNSAIKNDLHVPFRSANLQTFKAKAFSTHPIGFQLHVTKHQWKLSLIKL